MKDDTEERRQFQEPSSESRPAKDLVPTIISNLLWAGWRLEKALNARRPAPRLRWRIIITIDLRRRERGHGIAGKGSEGSADFKGTVQEIKSWLMTLRGEIKEWRHQGSTGCATGARFSA